MRLAIVASHPIQYYAPLYRAISKRVDLEVFYGHSATPSDQAAAGFGVPFDWDVDLLNGYKHVFLENVAYRPGTGRFGGVDTPSLGRRLSEGKYDAVLLMGWHLKIFHQGLWAAKGLGLPVMVRGDSHLGTPRATWKRWAKKLTYPIFLRFFDAALIVGERNREYWMRYGYPERRMWSVPHCVDNDWFAARSTEIVRCAYRSNLNIPPQTKVVLFAGKLVPFKRPWDLVEAVARIRGESASVELMVAGAGPLENELRSHAEALSVPVHWLGFRNQTEMPSCYAAADVLVLPSDAHETWGLVVNEALACGLPCLVSNEVGCAPDMASKLGASVTFPMGDVSILSNRIGGILANPPSPNGIRAAATAFSVGRAAEGLISALEMVKRR